MIAQVSSTMQHTMASDTSKVLTYWCGKCCPLKWQHDCSDQTFATFPCMSQTSEENAKLHLWFHLIYHPNHYGKSPVAEVYQICRDRPIQTTMASPFLWDNGYKDEKLPATKEEAMLLKPDVFTINTWKKLLPNTTSSWSSSQTRSE